MSYYLNTQPDLPLTYDGSDSFAGGQISALKANIIPNDAVSYLLNCDNTINGELVTRRGTTVIGSPPRSTPVNGLSQHDFGSGVKRTVYATRNAAQGELYRETAGTYTALTGTWTSGTMTNDIRVTFAELSGALYFTNGLGDMHKVAAGAGGADAFAMSTNGGATNANPPNKARWVVEHTNRLACLGSNIAGADYDPVGLFFSQFDDGTVWDRALWSFHVGRKSDRATGLLPWTQFDLVVFKEHSVYVVNCNPEVTPDNFTVKRVHPHIGCVCPATAVQVGDGVMFLSRDGVYSVDRTDDTDTRAEITVPMSADIDDIIKRINWTRAPITACAFFWNNRYFLGVPLDNDTENTWVVYNAISNRWLGTWGNALRPRAFATNEAFAQPRLRFGRDDGTMYEFLDYVQEKQEVAATYQDNGTDYLTRITSKGYVFGDVKAAKDLFNGMIEFNKSKADCYVGIRMDASAEVVVGLVSTGAQDVYLDATGALTGSPSPVLPFPLTDKQIILRELGLSNLQSCNEAQVDLVSLSGKLGVRSIQLAAFVGSDHSPSIDAAIVITPP